MFGKIINLAGKGYKLAKAGASRVNILAQQTVGRVGHNELIAATPEGLFLQARDKSLRTVEKAVSTAQKTGNQNLNKVVNKVSLSSPHF